MKTLKTAIITLLIFGLGSVAGGLVNSKVTHARIEKEGLPRPPAPAALPEAEWNAAQVEVMQRQLQLSPEQRGRIVEIFKRTQGDAQAMREEWKTRMRDMLQHADRSVVEVLSPEQRGKFEEFRQKRRQFLQRRQQGPIRERIEQFREGFGFPRSPKP